jgi:hypothetical protein
LQIVALRFGELVAETTDDHEDFPGGDDTSRRWSRRIGALRQALQDWLWNLDEKWASDRGLDTWRSPSGWAVHVRDRRFDLRHVCGTCDGTGRHRISGAKCADCAGVGVVTDPERGEQA